MIPAKLYKYRATTGQRVQQILRRGELYFAAPHKLDDPFEGRFSIDVRGAENEQVIAATALKVALRKHPEFSLEENYNAANTVAAMIVKERRGDVEKLFNGKLGRDTNARAGILALSEVNDNGLMWSGYADEHRGICLEFSTDCVGDVFRNARQVEYGDDIPSLDLRRIVVDEGMRQNASWMLRKSMEWQHQREWRIIDMKSGPGPKRFRPESLTGVILGCRIPRRQELKVRNWIKRWPTPVAIYRATQAGDRYRLSVNREV